jgi:hypothetical protein
MNFQNIQSLKISLVYWLFRLSWGIITLFFIFWAVYAWLNPYEKVAPEILNSYECWNNYPNFPLGVMPPGRFIGLRYFLILSSILLIISGLYLSSIEAFFIKIGFKLIENFRNLAKSLLYDWRKLSLYQRYLFFSTLILATIPKLYLVFIYPVFVDEAFSYASVISYGFGVTMTYYFLPNNHLFYNIVVVALDYLVFFEVDEPVILMRMVSLLFFIASWVILQLWLSRLFGFFFGLLVAFIWAFMPPINYYSFLGRGYGLQLFFILNLMILTYYSLKNFKNYTENRYFLILISVLGFYTVPSFLYPFASLGTLLIVYALLEKKYLRLLYLLGDALLIIFLVVCLYSITFLMSGPRLWVNMDLLPLDEHTILEKLQNLPNEFINFITLNNWLGLKIIAGLLLIGLVINSFQTRNQTLSILIISLFIVPIPIFIFLQKTVPPVRVLTYFTIPILLAILLFLENFIRQKVLILSFLIFYLFFNLSSFFSNYRLDYQYDSYKEIAEIVNQTPQKALRIEVDLNYYWFLAYEIRKKHQPINFVQQPAPNKPFDFLILAQNQAFPQDMTRDNYQAIYTDKKVILYKSKSN